MLGKLLLTIDAALLVFGSPIADYNKTHIFNPRWPPHAKFHNGQTMTLSVLLGLATFFCTWRSAMTGQAGDDSTPARMVARRERERDDFRTAAFVGSIYWLAGLAGYFFPGADGIDPEFGPSGFPQAPIFVSAAVMAIAGWILEAKS